MQEQEQEEEAYWLDIRSQGYVVEVYVSEG